MNHHGLVFWDVIHPFDDVSHGDVHPVDVAYVSLIGFTNINEGVLKLTLTPFTQFVYCDAVHGSIFGERFFVWNLPYSFRHGFREVIKEGVSPQS